MIFVKIGISLIAWSKVTLMKRFLSSESRLDSGMGLFFSTTKLSGEEGRLEEDDKGLECIGIG